MKRKIYRSGEGSVDACILVLVFAFCLFFLLEISAAAEARSELRYAAEAILKTASENGCVTGETEEKKAALEKELGYPLEAVYVCTYWNEEEGKVQLGEKITLTLKRTYVLKGIGGTEIPVELSVTETAVSEKYQK